MGNILVIHDNEGMFVLTYLAAPGTSRRHFLTVLNIALSLHNESVEF